MNTITNSDLTVASVINLIENSNLNQAQIELDEALSIFPTDIKLQYLDGVLYSTKNDHLKAQKSFWKTLTLDPQSSLIRKEIFDSIITSKVSTLNLQKDFSLKSGERQIADKIEKIRFDHQARYKFVADWILLNRQKPWLLNGVDAFCGNGYGSRIVSNACGAKLIGIDGSQAAIDIAERSYGNHRVIFGCAAYPFEILPKAFDFGICFESIEHIEDSEGLLSTISDSTEGPLFISVPNEDVLPFSIFGKQFEHHIKHFKYKEIIDLLHKVGRKQIISESGQIVYKTHAGKLSGLVPEEKMGITPFTNESQFIIIAAH